LGRSGGHLPHGERHVHIDAEVADLAAEGEERVNREPVEQAAVGLHLGQTRHQGRTHGAGNGVAHPITSASLTTSAAIARTFTPAPS